MVSLSFSPGDYKNVRHYPLAEEDILPFTYDSRDEAGPGGQGILEIGVLERFSTSDFTAITTVLRFGQEISGSEVTVHSFTSIGS